MSFCEPQSVSECYVDNTYGARRAREKRERNARENRVPNVLAVIYTLDVLVVVGSLCPDGRRRAIWIHGSGSGGTVLQFSPTISLVP